MIIIKYYSYIIIQTLISKQQFEWAGYIYLRREAIAERLRFRSFPLLFV